MSKVALVTGTNSGIGHSLALEFHKRGIKVYATDYQFSEPILKEFKDLGIITHVLDVRKIEDIRIVRDIIAKEEGKLDYLYNNAGIVETVHAVDISDDQLQNIYDINLFGPIKITREFVKLIINAKGTIVFSGSVTKNIPLHCNSLYVSTKAALDQYISVLQLELKNYGVKVIEVLGGLIKTEIFSAPVNTVHEDSIYNFNEYTEIFKDRKLALEKNKKKGMSTQVFAKRTLDQLEKANLNTFRIFEGGEAARLYYLPSFLPRSKLLNSMLDTFNLNFNYRKHLTDEKI